MIIFYLKQKLPVLYWLSFFINLKNMDFLFFFYEWNYGVYAYFCDYTGLDGNIQIYVGVHRFFKEYVYSHVYGLPNLQYGG